MSRKDPAVAAILGFFFGPLGLFYVSAAWAFGTFAALVILAVATGGVGCIAWFACAFIGYSQAQSINRTLAARADTPSTPHVGRPPPPVPTPPPVRAPLPVEPEHVQPAPVRAPTPPPAPGPVATGAPLPATHVQFAPGFQLDRYVIEKELGQGGMARVFQVRHAYLGSLHALKVLSPELVQNEDLRQRFLAEGRIQAQLRHTNIIPVTDVVAAPGIAGLVMDYVGGETLDDRLRSIETPPDAAFVRHVFRQVLAGVGFAHARGIVHRDLKPANILLEEGPTPLVRILDFGIAKMMTGDGGRATRTGMQMGTPHYMSPEQIQLGASVANARSDVFSLGVTLYEFATRTLPFEGTTDFDIQLKITQGRFRPAREVNPSIDPAIARAIDRALETDPARRFATCEDFSAALG